MDVGCIGGIMHAGTLLLFVFSLLHEDESKVRQRSFVYGRRYRMGGGEKKGAKGKV